MIMKKLLVILGLTLISNGLCAQFPVNFNFDLESQYNGITKYQRVEFIPGVTVRHRNHGLRFGLVVQSYTTEARNNRKEMRPTGLSAKYTFNCQTWLKPLEFFFSYEMKAQWFEEVWTENIYDFDLGIYKDHSYESEEFYSSQTIGYGFRLNFLGNFYLEQSVATGIRLSSIEGEAASGGAPTIKVYDFRGYDNFGFHWNASVALGYRF